MFDRIASAVRSDCVRRPIRLRPPPDQIAFAIYSYKHRMHTLYGFLFVPTVYLLLLIVVDLPFFAFASSLYLKLRFR